MPPNPSTPAPSDRTPRLSDQLTRLEAASQRQETVHLAEVIALLKGRAYTFLLLLLSVPFVQPIPIPGLSTPFGVAIALVGFGLLIGQTPWLPGWLLKLPLPKNFLAAALQVMRRLVRLLEALLRPRLVWLAAHPVLQRLQGLCILTCGVLLALPLPIPFSNMLPAVTVIAFACSLLEKDGLFYLVGLGCFALTAAFFLGVGLGGAAALAWVYEWLAETLFAE
jgi:hypothetical protein